MCEGCGESFQLSYLEQHYQDCDLYLSRTEEIKRELVVQDPIKVVNRVTF